MRFVLCVLAVMGLGACDGIPLQMPGLKGASIGSGETSTIVTRGDIKVSGPRGFCIDPQTTRHGAGSAFVVMGSCAAITGTSKAPHPANNAIVTTTVSMANPSVPKINQSSAQLAQFFDSNVGHILISRDNTSDSVTIREAGANKDGAFFLYVTDTSAGAPAGASDTYWRSYFDVRNTLVTISVLSLDASPLSKKQGLALLRSFTSILQNDAANATPENTPSPTPIAPVTSRLKAKTVSAKPVMRPDTATRS